MFSTNRNNDDQIKIRRKKNVKKGIQFCLMVCGASGTGKERWSIVSYTLYSSSSGATIVVTFN